MRVDRKLFNAARVISPTFQAYLAEYFDMQATFERFLSDAAKADSDKAAIARLNAAKAALQKMVDAVFVMRDEVRVQKNKKDLGEIPGALSNLVYELTGIADQFTTKLRGSPQERLVAAQKLYEIYKDREAAAFALVRTAA